MNLKSNSYIFTDEMYKIFVERSMKHRDLVSKNLIVMEGYLDLHLEELMKSANSHDQSKFHEPEKTAYVWITWMYYCKKENIPFQYPVPIKDIVYQGWQHHILHNAHHPEAHNNPNAMSELDIVEMVCDWTAIAQENIDSQNNQSCLEWATLHIDKKWSFSNHMKQLIFSTIRELDMRNQRRSNDVMRHEEVGY